MDVVHPRCAGVDVSKRDAKVCVRIAGAGRRKTVATVTTWGSVTNQVLALRDHLADQQVTLVVIPGHRGLLEIVLFRVGGRLRGDAGQPAACEEPARAQDRRLEMRHGWPTWEHTVWCAGRWCRQSRSGNCGI